jgi:hypothetical protein
VHGSCFWCSQLSSAICTILRNTPWSNCQRQYHQVRNCSDSVHIFQNGGEGNWLPNWLRNLKSHKLQPRNITRTVSSARCYCKAHFKTCKNNRGRAVANSFDRNGKLTFEFVLQQQALSVRRARSQSPKTSCPKVVMNIITAYKNIAYINTHINTEFLDCFMGALTALDTFPRFTRPQIIPHELAFVETCTFMHATAVHRPSLLHTKLL